MNYDTNERFIEFGMILLLSVSKMCAQAPDTLWTKTYGGSMTERAYSVQETSDDGFIIAGYTRSFGSGNSDVWLLKTDENGDTLWTKTYGSADDDCGYSVQQTSDGGYIIAGYTGQLYDCNVYLIKTDENGDTLWTKKYSGEHYDEAREVQETSDGGYIIVGTILAFPNYDVYLIKTDSIGDTLWTKTYGGTENDGGWSVQQTLDSGYIITGYTKSFGVGDADVYLIKTNQNGDTLWTSTWGDYEKDWSGYEVRQTSDGGYIIAGRCFFDLFLWEDGLLIKTDAGGNSLWLRTAYGGSLFSAQETSDGGYVAVGYVSYGDVYLVKTDMNGAFLWSSTYGGSEWDTGASIQQTSDDGFIIAGTYGTTNWNNDVYLIKIESETSIRENQIKNLPMINLKVSPNPFRQMTEIRWQIIDDRLDMTDNRLQLRIYDISGRLVRTFSINLRNQKKFVCWDGTDASGKQLPMGIYFCRLEVKDKVVTKKVILIREAK